MTGSLPAQPQRLRCWAPENSSFPKSIHSTKAGFKATWPGTLSLQRYPALTTHHRIPGVVRGTCYHCRGSQSTALWRAYERCQRRPAMVRRLRDASRCRWACYVAGEASHLDQRSQLMREQNARYQEQPHGADRSFRRLEQRPTGAGSLKL